MFRLLGFTTGAALAIGAIVMVMGIPELRDRSSVTDAALQPVDSTAAARSDVASPEPVAVLAEATAAAPPTRMTDEPVSTADAIAEIAPPTELAPPTNASFERADTDVPGSNPLWHSFWNPFRSEIAANGFAARLTAVTGIDYRVVRLEPGAYQVAFAYTDDTERAAKIAQIETATGLDLPEVAP